MTETMEIEEVTFLKVGGVRVCEIGQEGTESEGQWIARLSTGDIIGTPQISKAPDGNPIVEINGIRVLGVA